MTIINKQQKLIFILAIAILLIFFIIFLSLVKGDTSDALNNNDNKNFDSDLFQDEDIFGELENSDSNLENELLNLELEDKENSLPVDNLITDEDYDGSENEYQENYKEEDDIFTDKKINNSLNFSIPENCQYHLVTRVFDGDTIEIEGGERVRYIGIDTPETVHPAKPVECFGREASFKNKELVLNKKVCLVKDVTNRDRYNRLLRYVYLDDKFINLELVKLGYATSYSYPPDISQQYLFIEAQKQARENNLGLWSACSDEKEIDWGGKCLIKGNISSGGKIYHLPNCGSYDKTVIDESMGERWFCSESEAVEAGWRKALNCE